MFSPRVTSRDQSAVEAAIKLKLRRYTVEECQQWRKHLESLLDEDGNLRADLRPHGLLPDENSFIINEQLLCTLDFLYWAERYAWIISQFGDKMLYKPNIAQKIYLDILSEMEEKGIALMIQALKARQLGITTLSELIIAHRVQFHPVDAVVASSDPEKSAKMARIMEYIWENMPWYLLPARKPWKNARASKEVRYRAGELIVFPQINSAISIQWGNQTTGICRGATPKVAHLSELCDFENPEELVDASLVRAMHENPKMFLCLESTAKGKDGSGKWWYNTWQFNKDNWPGAARLYPMFLPWYVGTDMYPGPTYLLKNPIPKDWQPPQHIIDHALKAEKFVAGYPLLKKYLGENWKMPLEQKWFYEANRREYVAKGTLADWFSEMPADDYECFQTSGTSVLGPELIAEYRDRCQEPLGAFILDGPEIPAQLRLARLPVSLRRDAPSLPVNAGYAFRPIHIDKYPLISFQNKVFIWEMPEKNEEYAIGVDTAEGVGKDNTVIQVIRKGSPDRHAAQVAEFASKDINAYESWPFVWALASLYSTSINGLKRQAKVVVECAANGSSVQDELKKRGWRRFHIRSQPSRRQYNLAQERLLGWKTDTMTRPIMIDFLLTGLKERWLDINSPKLVDELDMLWLNEKRHGRIEHRPDSHDDRVFSLGIGLYSLHWNGIYRSPSPMYVERQEQEAERSKYAIYKPGLAERGTTLDNRVVK